jgi:hypothetical protein
MAGLPTYAPEEAPQWVHDVVENLQREHDNRVEEYIELEKMLPMGFERDAMRRGVAALADAGLTLVAARLQHYLLRLEATAH